MPPAAFSTSASTPTIGVGIQANAWQRELPVKDHLPDVLRCRPATPPTHARKATEELRTQTEHLTEVAHVNRDLCTYYHNHAAEFAHQEDELRAILEVDPALLSLCLEIGDAARALPVGALPAARS